MYFEKLQNTHIVKDASFILLQLLSQPLVFQYYFMCLTEYKQLILTIGENTTIIYYKWSYNLRDTYYYMSL